MSFFLFLLIKLVPAFLSLLKRATVLASRVGIRRKSDQMPNKVIQEYTAKKIKTVVKIDNNYIYDFMLTLFWASSLGQLITYSTFDRLNCATWTKIELINQRSMTLGSFSQWSNTVVHKCSSKESSTPGHVTSSFASDTWCHKLSAEPDGVSYI